MDERIDGFEATFVLDVARQDVWERLAEHPPPTGARLDEGQRWLPGFDAPVDEVDVEPGRRLRGRKPTEPCAGTEILVVLEDEGTGTRITVTQAGFGAWFDAMRELLGVGWSHIVADLALALGRGVGGGRHALAWGALGAGTVATPAGLAVATVDSEGLARRLGLQPDDVVLVVAGAAIATEADLQAALRVIRALAPAAVDVAWCRGGERLVATAAP